MSARVLLRKLVSILVVAAFLAGPPLAILALGPGAVSLAVGIFMGGGMTSAVAFVVPGHVVF